MGKNPHEMNQRVYFKQIESKNHIIMKNYIEKVTRITLAAVNKQQSQQSNGITRENYTGNGIKVCKLKE